MKNQYNIDYFINKFSKIPRSAWITGLYTIGEKHDIFGHCGADDYHEFTLERMILEKLADKAGITCMGSVNDRLDYRFQQKTVKGRVMGALRFIKRKTEKRNKKENIW